MSLHAQISPEILERLRIQQRNNTITSVIIAILVVVLLGVVMFWFLMPSAARYTDDLVAYQTSTEEEKEMTKPKIERAVENKPTAPAASPSMAKVLTSNSVSEIAIPVVTNFEPTESVDFGASMNLGDSWGDVDFAKAMGGETSFFGSKVSGDKILYIIDYSLSMKSQGKANLMRDELEKSVKKLPGGARFQLMFFAGPVWIASDTINDVKGASINSITTIDGEELKWAKDKTDGKVRKVDWLTVDKKVINDAVTRIRKSPLVLGTKWGPSFEMAFKMSPKPDAIVFMTDGAGGDAKKAARDYGSKARRAGIPITAIALMEPKARDSMISLAKETKGSFAIIGKGGRKEEAEDFSEKK